MNLKRRALLKTVPAAIATSSLVKTGSARAQVHRVVIVGGGFGGATAAKYLAHWGNGAVDVTLVDDRPSHVSCIMSNLVLNEQLSLDDLSFDLGASAAKHGFTQIVDRVVAIDGPGHRVTLRDSGDTLEYDSLIVAAGIAFVPPAGAYDPMLSPHGWVAGEQTLRLKELIDTMPDNGTFILTIPKSPYRCPPGPYERACAVADILGRRSGTLDGGAPGDTPSVIVLDANDRIQAEATTFSRAFSQLYGHIIDYRTGAELLSVDSKNGIVQTSAGEFSGDLLNILPTHRAGDLLVDSGLTGDGLWAPVDPVTYASRLVNEFPDVHVIGDSQASGQPKSGHMANAQAKICADAILRKAAGLSAHTAERLSNLRTNSACFSPVTADEASWLTAVFAYDEASGNMKLVPESLGEARRWSRKNYREMFTWSENLFSDTFG